jgi:DNA-binding NarL/FixJ family response regulator
VIRVLLVDDHQILRASLGRLLDAEEDVQVIGTSGDGSGAVSLVSTARPDVVLMDLSMPGMDGVEATRRIVELDLGTKVVVLTSFSDGERIRDALDAGAIGYLLKDAEPDDLLKGVRAAARGDWPLDPRAARLLLSGQGGRAVKARLSERELEVLGLVAEGLPNKALARRLGISERTVKAHLTRIYEQLGVSDRTQAALWAQRRGVTPLPEGWPGPRRGPG